MIKGINPNLIKLESLELALDEMFIEHSEIGDFIGKKFEILSEENKQLLLQNLNTINNLIINNVLNNEELTNIIHTFINARTEFLNKLKCDVSLLNNKDKESEESILEKKSINHIFSEFI